MARDFETLSKPVRADPRRRARVEQRKRAILKALSLAELREARDARQVDLADELGVSQANVSRIERQDDLYLSTLSSYVEALGGRLEIAAVFPDLTIHLVVEGAPSSGAGPKPDRKRVRP